MTARPPDPLNAFVILAVFVILAFGVACTYGWI